MDTPRRSDRWRPWHLPWLWIALATVVLGVLAAHLPLLLRYRREQRAIAEIDNLGGSYRYEQSRSGPPWPLTYLGKRYARLFDRVQWVFLDGTRVTDAELSHLAGLTSIERLDLHGTQVTDAGLSHLAGLTTLAWLLLRGTQVTDAGLLHLTGLTSLELLDLSGTQVTDAGLAHLAKSTSLRVLDLSGTQVTDAGLSHLKGLTRLLALNISRTQVTDAGVAALRRALPRVHATTDEAQWP